MKVEDKKKLCNKIFSRIFLALFIAFLAIYVSSASGYYEFEQHNKMVLTEEKIKEFEQDVADGKEVDIKNYIVSDTPNYQNSVSKLGNTFSTQLEKFVQSGLESTFEFLNKLLQG